jgi:hypothetical protein
MPSLLTLAEVASRLRVSRSEARAIVLGYTGLPAIPHLRLSSGPRAAIRVPEEALVAWIAARIGESSPLRAMSYSRPPQPNWDALLRREGVLRRFERG